VTDQTETPEAAPVDLSDRERYMALVVQRGLERRRNFGRDFSEADYLSGAMVIFEHDGQLGELPGGWVFGLMAGGSPLGITEQVRHARCEHRRCDKVAQIESERADVPEGWHLLALNNGLGYTPTTVRFCSRRHLRAWVRNDLDDDESEE